MNNTNFDDLEEDSDLSRSLIEEETEWRILAESLTDSEGARKRIAEIGMKRRGEALRADIDKHREEEQQRESEEQKEKWGEATETLGEAVERFRPADSLYNEYDADPTIKDKLVSFLEVALYEYDVHPEQFAEEIFSQLEAEDAIRGLMESTFPQAKGNHDEFQDEFNELLMHVLREMEGLLGGRSEFEAPRSETGFRRMAIRQLEQSDYTYADRIKMLQDPTISAERRAEIQGLVDKQVADAVRKLEDQQRRQEEEGEEGWWGTTPGERKAARLATPSVEGGERLLSQDVTAQIYDEERNVTWDEREFLPAAERRVAEDPKGETQKLLDQGLLAMNDGAITISPEEIVTHNLLHNHWYRKALASEDIEDMKVFRRVVEALRAVRSTWGASGGQMHDPTGGRMAGNYTAPVNPLIRGAVLREAMIEGSDSWRAKMNRARNALKKAGERKDKNWERRARLRIEKLETKWEKKYGQLISFLKRQGVDVDNIDVLARDEILSQKILNKIASHGATWRDVRFEYYRNALLTGLMTTEADIIGSGSFAIWKVGVGRAIEAFANSLRRATPGVEINTDEATWAEFKDVMLGMKHGFTRSFGNVWKAMITEKPQLQRWIDQDKVTGKFDNLSIAIKNRVLGRIVRGMGYTRLLMADEFFQTMVVYMEIGAQARRMALVTENPNTPGENYKTGTKDMADYITAASRDQRHGAWMKALEIARQVTFQSEGGTVRKTVKKVGKSITQEAGAVSRHWLSFEMPFMGTPINIIAESLSYSPVGIFALAGDWVAKSKTEEGVPYATERMVVQMLNWAAIMYLVYNNDDDHPIITGANDHIGMNAERTARRTIPARSVRIPFSEDEDGNALYAPYDRVEPAVLGLTLITDISNAIRRAGTTTEKWLGGVKAPLPSVADTIANKAYFETLAEIQKMATLPSGGSDDTMLRKIAKHFARRTAGYVPNFMRHAVKAIGDVQPERRVRGLTTEEFAESLFTRTIQGADLFPYLKPDHEKFDAWGYQMLKEPELPFMGTWWTRIGFPSRIQRERWFVGDTIIRHWNEQNPQDDYNFPYLNDLYIDPKSGKQRSMTNDQLEEAQFTIGTIQRHIMELAAEHLTEQDRTSPSLDVKNIVEQSRGTGSNLGRNLLVAKWHKGLKSMPNLEDASQQRYSELIAYHGKVLARKGPGRWTSAAKRKYKTQEAWAEAVETSAKNLETSRTWLQSRRIPVRDIERAIPRRGTILRRRLREYSQAMQ